MSDEFTRIAGIRRILEREQSVARGVVVGIGDDAAVLAASVGNTVLSVDAAVEHVHFERTFATLDVIGERAFVAALSDLAAMGATPRAALSALVLPAHFADEELELLMAGIARASARDACPVVGGNLSRGSELSLTTTVMGELQGAALTRAGAKAGDKLYVTGVLGSAALGLALLQRQDTAASGERFIARWRQPRARIREGTALLGHATAAIDVSDGALQDLAHLCEASGVGVELHAAQLPSDDGYAELARALGHDPVTLALTGGEDYELLYTLPPALAHVAVGTCIGEITAQTGLVVRDATGNALQISGRGHLHFA